MFLHQIAHLFYEPNMQPQGITLLNEEESGHIIKALRKRIGDLLHTTDGLGNLYEVEILELQKRQVALKTVKIFKEQAHPNPEVHIAIAPLKQMDRFEWFLEKAVEIGVTSITPIVTKRTERTVLKPERLQKIMVSAMKQSQRFHLPELNLLTPFAAYLKSTEAKPHAKMMGWCAEDEGENLPKAQKLVLNNAKSIQILIGPEGDFTPEEATQAKAAGFQSMSLGNYRLRTETAAIVAITLVQS
jgi:16S rRNA (uracil1498-N3)-methyltransferase